MIGGSVAVRTLAAEDVVPIASAFAAWPKPAQLLAERLVASRTGRVGAGVGLYADDGAAQRLYVRRGYVPDGRGIHYDGRPVPGGARVVADDDLALYLVKDLAPYTGGAG